MTRVAVALAAALLLAATVEAQRGFGGFGGYRGASPVLANVPYDGRFTFVRLRYGPATEYVSQRIPW